MQVYALRLAAKFCLLAGLFFISVPFGFAQSSQVEAEWALYNQILIIGIIVGIVVFGLLFYAIIRYREKPQKTSEK